MEAVGKENRKETKRTSGLFSRSRCGCLISGRDRSRSERNGDHEGVKTVCTAEMLECSVIGLEPSPAIEAEV